MGLYEQALADGLIAPPTAEEQVREDVLADVLSTGRAVLYGPGGEVVAEVTVPPFPVDASRTVCACGGIC